VISLRSLLWFLVAGALGFIADVAVLLSLRPWLGPYAARVLSFLAAATVTWLLNRQMAFGGPPSGLSLRAEYLRYLGIMLGGAAINYAVYAVLVFMFGSTALRIALCVAAGSIAGLAANFLGARRLYPRT
jgi:putative flippase GtrA